MIKTMTLHIDVIKCQCGSVHMRKPDKIYYTCPKCGTTMLRTGKILVRGLKELQKA